MEAIQAQPQRKLHPVVWAAAISVIVFSAVGVAAITGLLPTTHGQSAAEKTAEAAFAPPPAPVAAAVPAPATPIADTPAAAPKAIEEVEQPAPKPAPKFVDKSPVTKPSTHAAKPAATHSAARAAKPAPVRAAQAPNDEPVQVAQAELAPPPAPAICHECGTVTAVRAIEQKGEGSGVGAVGGAVAGGVLGHQMGGGRGRDVMTVIGAIAGGLGGHEIEKNVRKVVKHEVTVRFEDGGTRTFNYDKTPLFRGGDHVRLSQGELVIDNH